MEKYVVLGVMGEGTYGKVMKCMDETTGSTVAVKKLRKALDRGQLYRQMIVRELNLLRMLRNDHVVPIIETYRYCDYIYMVFPFMRHNLYRFLELNGGSLTLDRTKECMYQVLMGLDYIHSQNVIHRDIKPENVLLSPTGIVKICDFGLSRLFCSKSSLNLSPGLGTVWYQAPEVLMNSKNYDTKVDIWSAGIMFTELVNKLPIVTENTIIAQLYGIAKILSFKGDDQTFIKNYLQKYGISLNIENQQKPFSRSYTIANTVLALQKIYTIWPIHLLEIVANCLQLNPENRKNTTQLLEMQFFTVGSFILNFNQMLKLRLENEKVI